MVSNIDQFSKSMNQWAALMSTFNDSLKQLGDVDNWAKVIETDLAEISTILEYVYKQSNPAASSLDEQQPSTSAPSPPPTSN